MTENIILNFYYKGQEVKINCKKNDNMNDVLKRYTNKINKDINNIYFINNGNIINKDNLKLEELNNKDNKINILVYDIDKNEKINQVKDIICPLCMQNCIIEIKDYKVNLNKCDNKHNINNILLDEYNNTQKIDEIKIKCNNCNKNKFEIYNNKIYKCYKCNTNLCPLCKSSHNKEHIIIDYDLINYICNKHDEKYSSYCKECEKNICDTCKLDHNNHNRINYRDIIENKDNNMHEIKIKIDLFKKEIESIINKLNIIIKNIDIYYNINNNINHNNMIKNKNYQILINKNNINKYNNNIIKDIDNIIKENNIIIKFQYLNEIYNKMIDKNNKNISNEKEKFEDKSKNNNKKGKNEGEHKNGKKEKKDNKGILYGCLNLIILLFSFIFLLIFNKMKSNNNIVNEKDISNNIIINITKIYNIGKYVGEYKNGKREGKGIFYYNNGNRYEGDFKNDKKEGKGKFYYNSGKWKGNRYEGDFKNDKKEGKGIFYYNNGNRYEGDFKNDKKEGKGIYYFNNSNRYEGDIKNGKSDGEGIYYYSNGDRKMGDYINGTKIGIHVTLHKNGDITSKYYNQK